MSLQETVNRRRPVGRLFLGALAVVAVLLGWLQSFIVHEQLALSLLLTLTAVAALVLLRQTLMGTAGRAGMVMAAVVVVTQVWWSSTGWPPIRNVALTTAIIMGFGVFAAVWLMRPAQRGVTGPTRIGLVLMTGAGWLLSLAAAIVSVALIVTAFSAVPLAYALQSALNQHNSFAPHAPTQATVVNGAGLTNDVRYASEYPNSYLDIYIAHNNPSISRPTYVVVHGGGFIFGDKMEGDPNTGGGNAYFALGAGPMLNAGYNVVAINYALAPEYRYPTPVIQLGQAMQFLEANGARYGLDMSRVVLSGGSAGGHIVGQYANVQINPAYAQSIGMKPTMNPKQLKALVFDSAALDVSRIATPQMPNTLDGWLFDVSARNYLADPHDEKTVRESNIIENTSAAFPPSFVSDGNDATFPDQAADLAARLQNMGIPSQLNLYTRQQAILGHGFMAHPSRWTDDYNRLKINFLSRFAFATGT